MAVNYQPSARNLSAMSTESFTSHTGFLNQNFELVAIEHLVKAESERQKQRSRGLNLHNTEKKRKEKKKENRSHSSLTTSDIYHILASSFSVSTA